MSEPTDRPSLFLSAMQATTQHPIAFSELDQETQDEISALVQDLIRIGDEIYDRAGQPESSFLLQLIRLDFLPRELQPDVYVPDTFDPNEHIEEHDGASPDEWPLEHGICCEAPDILIGHRVRVLTGSESTRNQIGVVDGERRDYREESYWYVQLQQGPRVLRRTEHLEDLEQL